MGVTKLVLVDSMEVAVVVEEVLKLAWAGLREQGQEQQQEHMPENLGQNSLCYMQ